MGINRDKLKAKNQSAAGQIWQQGANYIRVFPRSTRYFTDEDDDFVYKYHVHYLPTLGDERTQIICPNRLNKPCPICMLAKGLYATNKQEDKAVANKLYRRYRYLMSQPIHSHQSLPQLCPHL